MKIGRERKNAKIAEFGKIFEVALQKAITIQFGVQLQTGPEMAEFLRDKDKRRLSIWTQVSTELNKPASYIRKYFTCTFMAQNTE